MFVPRDLTFYQSGRYKNISGTYLPGTNNRVFHKILHQLCLLRFLGFGEMYTQRLLVVGCAAIAVALLFRTEAGFSAQPQKSQSLVAAALENITNLNRPGQDGYATVWDGNKYVQCKRLPDRNLRC
jgi:hypothetical protein